MWTHSPGGFSYHRAASRDSLSSAGLPGSSKLSILHGCLLRLLHVQTWTSSKQKSLPVFLIGSVSQPALPPTPQHTSQTRTLSFCFVCFETVFLHSPSWPCAHQAAEADLEFTKDLPLNFWSPGLHRCVPPHPIRVYPKKNPQNTQG